MGMNVMHRLQGTCRDLVSSLSLRSMHHPVVACPAACPNRVAVVTPQANSMSA